MAMNASRTIVAVFDEPAMADRAVEDLQNAGFHADQVHYWHHDTTDSSTGEGFFAGLKRLFTGDDVKTTGDNSVDDFSSMGYSNSEAQWYNDQYNAGRAVVSVNAGNRAEDAMQILHSDGAYNYDMRASNLKTGPDFGKPTSTGYAGSQEVGQPATSTQTGATFQQPTNYAPSAADVDTDTNRSMRLREEQLQAEKERVQSGEVRLHKNVVEEQRTITVPVTHEEVYVEVRDVPAGQVDAAPIGEDEVVRVPVSEEQVNVTKTPVVTGEVAIGKRAVTENQQVTDTVKREEAHLRRSGDVDVNGSGADMLDPTTDTARTDTQNNSL